MKLVTTAVTYPAILELSNAFNNNSQISSCFKGDLWGKKSDYYSHLDFSGELPSVAGIIAFDIITLILVVLAAAAQFYFVTLTEQYTIDRDGDLIGWPESDKSRVHVVKEDEYSVEVTQLNVEKEFKFMNLVYTNQKFKSKNGGIGYISIHFDGSVDVLEKSRRPKPDLDKMSKSNIFFDYSNYDLLKLQSGIIYKDRKYIVGAYFDDSTNTITGYCDWRNDPFKDGTIL